MNARDFKRVSQAERLISEACSEFINTSSDERGEVHESRRNMFLLCQDAAIILLDVIGDNTDSFDDEGVK